MHVVVPEVHRNEPETGRRIVRKSVPAVQENGHVVKPVKKDYRFLLKHQEHGIDKLRNLGVDE